MPQEKIAGISAKNYSDLLDILKANGMKASAARKAVDEHIVGEGTGSFVMDGVLGVGKAIFKDKMPTKKITNLRRNLASKDIEAGKKIQDWLGSRKSKLLNKNVKDWFSDDIKFNTGKSTPGAPDQYIGVNVPMISKPFDKAKKIALPLAGAMAISSGVEKLTGGAKMDKEQNAKYELIEKISSLYNSESNEQGDVVSLENVDTHALESMIKTASKMLRYAAQENKKLLMENEKLASENSKLQSDINFKVKFDLATKLANEMNQKSLIKKADIEQQIQKIIDMDETSYEMLKTAVENVSVTESVGIDNLAFLGAMNSEKESRKTLKDSIEEG